MGLIMISVQRDDKQSVHTQVSAVAAVLKIWQTDRGSSIIAGVVKWGCTCAIVFFALVEFSLLSCEEEM